MACQYTWPVTWKQSIEASKALTASSSAPRAELRRASNRNRWPSKNSSTSPFGRPSANASSSSIASSSPRSKAASSASTKPSTGAQGDQPELRPRAQCQPGQLERLGGVALGPGDRREHALLGGSGLHVLGVDGIRQPAEELARGRDLTAAHQRRRGGYQLDHDELEGSDVLVSRHGIGGRQAPRPTAPG